jgi:hypothetical protein
MFEAALKTRVRFLYANGDSEGEPSTHLFPAATMAMFAAHFYRVFDMAVERSVSCMR